MARYVGLVLKKKYKGMNRPVGSWIESTVDRAIRLQVTRAAKSRSNESPVKRNGNDDLAYRTGVPVEHMIRQYHHTLTSASQ